MFVVSAEMTLSLVGPLAVGASSLERSHFRLGLVFVSVKVSLFLPRALSTVQTPSPQYF